jgi:glutamate synthase domain-containing protein 3
VGDHGCEYMTGGRVIVLGRTGRNFAAGMSGGVAVVLDVDRAFSSRCNLEMVDLEPLEDEEEIAALHALVTRHASLTGSAVATRVLAAWPAVLSQFVVVMPRDFKRVRAAATPARAETVPAWVDRLGA